MKKTRTTITIDIDLLRRGKKNRISISSFLDIELRKYLAVIEGKSRNQQEVFDTSFFIKDVWTGRDLNPWPPPCEGGDLPLIYQPVLKNLKRYSVFDCFLKY